MYVINLLDPQNGRRAPAVESKAATLSLAR
jgi:hypothetical protein